MGALSFTFVDVLVVAVMIVSAIHAAYRGFMRETFSVIAWIAAAFAALFFGPALTHALRGLLSGWAAIAVAYGVIFLVVVIPLSFMSFRVAENVRRSPVNAVDRALGVVFGAVRGLAVIAICYILFGLFVPPRDQPKWLTEARFLPVIQSSAETLLAVVPDQHIERDEPKPASKLAEPKKHAAKKEKRLASATTHKHAAKKVKKKPGNAGADPISKLIENNGGAKQP